jgi:L-ascorbate metabolism protein UlaG (beta-lactamase superfamily)
MKPAHSRLSRRRRTAALLLATSLAATPVAADVEIVYLGNEGVAIGDGRMQILVDALFGDGLAGYPSVPPEIRTRLERAKGEFSAVDLVLATHHHGDHFDAAAVARHLTANPGAQFVSTPEAVSLLLARPGASAFEGRARALVPAEGDRETLTLGEIRLTAYNLHHGRDRRPPVANLGFRIEIGGRIVLLVGDTEASFEEISDLGLADEGVDLALLPYWHLFRDEAEAGVRRTIDPDRVAVFHLPRPDAPRRWFGEQVDLEGTVRFLRQAWPGVVILHRNGDRIVLGDDSARR